MRRASSPAGLARRSLAWALAGVASAWLGLAPPSSAASLAQHALTISKQGAGSGTVTSSPAGIDCGATCSAQFDDGTVVTLTATPDQGSVFAGWSGGGCSGSGTCQVTLTSDTQVTATFAAAHRLDVQTVVPGDGFGEGGTITSDPAGIDCGGGPVSCSALFEDGTTVTLTVSPDAGWAFIGWSGGGCSGTGECQVTMSADVAVGAFLEPTLTVQKQGAGSGTVTSSPAGIDCGATCSAPFAEQTTVTLTAMPDAGSTFAGWSGEGCSGTGTCQVTVSGVGAVIATFGKPLAPDTEITAARVNKARRRATFSFGATGPGPYGFECRLTRQSPRLAAYRSCSSPRSYRRLRPGRHVFYVRASGPGGTDPTPARRAFRIPRG